MIFIEKRELVLLPVRRHDDESNGIRELFADLLKIDVHLSVTVGIQNRIRTPAMVDENCRHDRVGSDSLRLTRTAALVCLARLHGLFDR